MEVVFPCVHFIKHKRRRLAFMKLTPGLLRFLCPTIKILEPELSLIRVPKREHQKVQKNGVPKMCIFIIFILIATLVTFVCKGRQVGSKENWQPCSKVPVIFSFRVRKLFSKL